MARRLNLRSFLAGSVLGGALVVASRRTRPTRTPQGLAAFEGAPCDRADGEGRLSDAPGDGDAEPAPRP